MQDSTGSQRRQGTIRYRRRHRRGNKTRRQQRRPPQRQRQNTLWRGTANSVQGNHRRGNPHRVVQSQPWLRRGRKRRICRMGRQGDIGQPWRTLPRLRGIPRRHGQEAKCRDVPWLLHEVVSLGGGFQRQGIADEMAPRLNLGERVETDRRRRQDNKPKGRTQSYGLRTGRSQHCSG